MDRRALCTPMRLNPLPVSTSDGAGRKPTPQGERRVLSVKDTGWAALRREQPSGGLTPADISSRAIQGAQGPPNGRWVTGATNNGCGPPRPRLSLSSDEEQQGRKRQQRRSFPGECEDFLHLFLPHSSRVILNKRSMTTPRCAPWASPVSPTASPYAPSCKPVKKGEPIRRSRPRLFESPLRHQQTPHTEGGPATVALVTSTPSGCRD